MSQNDKIQILVAIIGFVGVIIASVIGNWDKLQSSKNTTDTNKIGTTNKNTIDKVNNDLSTETLVPISFYGKIKYLDIYSSRTAFFKNNILKFHEWGYVTSKEKLINTDSTRISFKLKFSTDALMDNKGKIWKPVLYFILLDKPITKDNLYKNGGINIKLPSNEEKISIYSLFGPTVEFKYSGEELLNPGKWHDITIIISYDTLITITIDSLSFDTKYNFKENKYYLALKSHSSADFQIKDLIIKK